MGGVVGVYEAGYSECVCTRWRLGGGIIVSGFIVGIV